MAANLLKSEQAAKISVYVVWAFVKLRELLSTHRELAVKRSELEGKLQNHDERIIALINAIRSLMAVPSFVPVFDVGNQASNLPKKSKSCLNRFLFLRHVLQCLVGKLHLIDGLPH